MSYKSFTQVVLGIDCTVESNSPFSFNIVTVLIESSRGGGKRGALNNFYFGGGRGENASKWCTVWNGRRLSIHGGKGSLISGSEHIPGFFSFF